MWVGGFVSIWAKIILASFVLNRHYANARLQFLHAAHSAQRRRVRVGKHCFALPQQENIPRRTISARRHSPLPQFKQRDAREIAREQGANSLIFSLAAYVCDVILNLIN
jgi:hypothetical protein